MRASSSLAVALALALCWGVALPASADITGSVLPTSRSVQVGQTATAFASIINAGATTATSCGLELGTPINASFTFRTTDPATNLPIVPPQTRVDIAPNQRQSWVFGITPNAAFNPTEVTIRMTCSNTAPAPVFTGVNTLLLSASSSPVPDVIALAATLANDGVVRSPGTRGTGVFAVASANVGAAGSITAVPQIVGNAGGATALICETNATGSCAAPPSAAVTTSVTAGGTNSFGVFVIANGQVDFDPANTRVNVRFNDAGSVVRGAAGVAFETQTQLASGGGTLEYEATTVSLDTNAAWAPVSVGVALRSTPPQPLPVGFGGAERVRDVTVSDQTRLDAPMNMILDYSPAAIGGGQPFVLHHDSATGQYDPVTVYAVDSAGGRVSVDSRNFSSFVTTVVNAVLPASYSVPTFNPSTNAWNIQNFGSYLTPGGNCLGMSAYAIWFLQNRSSETLSTKYSTAGGAPISIAHLTATRAHLAQSQYWAILQFRVMNALSDQQIAARMKAALALFGRPLVMILGTNGSPQHATVLYGYNATGFLHYEVNTAPGGTRTATVPFDGTSFGTYTGFNDFTYLGLPSLGRNEDFAGLTQDAEGGFATSSNINVTSPTQGQQVNDRKVNLIGTLTGALASGRDVVAYTNGERTPVGNGINSFNKEVPVKFGSNTLIVLAGDINNQSRWYKNAATLVRTFTGTQAPSTFRSTLTWNKTGDVDLYVTEPGGETAWWSHHSTSHGLTLDFDNTSGFGPENTTLSVGAGGVVQAGTYKVRVHFYSGSGPVSGTVQILLNEGAANQKNQTLNWTISANGSSSTTGPGGTGPQWTDIADVNVVNSVITPR